MQTKTNLEKLMDLVKYNGIKNRIGGMTFRAKPLCTIEGDILNVTCLEVTDANDVKEALINIIKIQKVAPKATFKIIGKNKVRGVTFWQIKEN